MKLEHLSPDDLKPYEKNPRINDHAVDAVARSIREFGFNSPIIVDEDNRICVGNTRWKAAKKLGLKSIPVIRVNHLVGEKFAAYNIADNKTASLALWDDEKLLEQLQEFHKLDFDLSSLAFSEAELQAMLTPEIDFDWSAYEKDLELEQSLTHILFPVKVNIGMTKAFGKAIVEYAQQHNIKEKDSAILAGKVFGKLLGLS